MAPADRINISPNFKQQGLPCDGQVGDLIVLSPLDRDEFDDSPKGKASLWLCTKSAWEPENIPAVWSRVQFDGFATCEFPVPEPPQDIPNLSLG
ncbi:hypothetical protein [Rhodococcus sp. M8-35]|uniref:hypothetical protein n=1 Tax=Rhodococcus sp. M8-35 TaxID=3058401 RepID=UPI002ECFF479